VYSAAGTACEYIIRGRVEIDKCGGENAVDNMEWRGGEVEWMQMGRIRRERENALNARSWRN
jgi:hypothetical protein